MVTEISLCFCDDKAIKVERKTGHVFLFHPDNNEYTYDYVPSCYKNDCVSILFKQDNNKSRVLHQKLSVLHREKIEDKIVFYLHSAIVQCCTMCGLERNFLFLSSDYCEKIYEHVELGKLQKRDYLPECLHGEQFLEISTGAYLPLLN